MEQRTLGWQPVGRQSLEWRPLGRGPGYGNPWGGNGFGPFSW